MEHICQMEFLELRIKVVGLFIFPELQTVIEQVIKYKCIYTWKNLLIMDGVQ